MREEAATTALWTSNRREDKAVGRTRAVPEEEERRPIRSKSTRRLNQALNFAKQSHSLTIRPIKSSDRKKAYNSNRSIHPEASSDTQEASSESINVLKWLTALIQAA